MRFLKSIVPFMVVTAAVSCGKSESSDGGSSSGLDGTWVSSCESDGQSGSTKTTSLIAGTSLTATTVNYSDAACTTATNSSIFSATLTLGGAVSTPAGAKEFSSKVTKISVTLKDDSTLAFYNGELGTSAICGGGFVKDVAKELNATNCKDDVLYGALFDEVFTIYKVDGNKLYQGQCGDDGTATDCSAATKRPTSLEQTYSTKA